MFQNTPLQFVESVLDDIDDICVYEVPHKADLNNCKQKGHDVKRKAVNLQLLLMNLDFS